jgi:hypothetical protein
MRPPLKLCIKIPTNNFREFQNPNPKHFSTP